MPPVCLLPVCLKQDANNIPLALPPKQDDTNVATLKREDATKLSVLIIKRVIAIMKLFLC